MRSLLTGCQPKQHMIKIQVLKFMGIVTVMRLSVFAIAAISLLVALTWLMIYCPTGVFYSSKPNQQLNVHNTNDHLSVESEDYFDQVEKKIFREAGEERIRESESKSKDAQEKADQGSNVVPEKLYTDKAFERLIEELLHKNTDEYEFMAESTNVTIYRKPKGNAGLYEYKLYAILPHSTPEQITAVFLDNEYRLVWDNYVTGLYHVKKADKGPDVLYFNVDYPWPLANRDYVYSREGRKYVRDGKEYITMVMHSVLNDNVPQERGVIRVTDFHQSVAMAKYGEDGSQAYIEYYDDPKGSVPSWLVNWAAKTGVPAFLKDLQRACSGLDEFLKKKGRPRMTVPPHTK